MVSGPAVSAVSLSVLPAPSQLPWPLRPPRPGGAVPDPGHLVTHHSADIPAPVHMTAEKQFTFRHQDMLLCSPEVNVVLPGVLLVQRLVSMAVHQPEHAQQVRHLLRQGALGPHQDSAPSWQTCQIQKYTPLVQMSY